MWIENNCKTTVTNCGFMVVLIKIIKNNIKITTPLVKPQLLTVVLREIVKPQFQIVVLRIFM